MPAKQRPRRPARRNPSTENLFESQVRLQATALETAANGILITDAQGTILWVNSSFTALTGFSVVELLGNNPRLLQSGMHNRAYYERLWKIILAGQSWHGEFVNCRKDGTVFYSEQTITPVCDTDGRVTHLVG